MFVGVLNLISLANENDTTIIDDSYHALPS
jgi:hypothetical protein